MGKKPRKSNWLQGWSDVIAQSMEDNRVSVKKYFDNHSNRETIIKLAKALYQEELEMLEQTGCSFDDLPEARRLKLMSDADNSYFIYLKVRGVLERK